ncbi:NUDIX hydrolase [Enterococcus rivorum]|uniref:Nudix hydrolase domain-containing protein n=2 Tax=Enterococcus rivorum TaxID=762845 RepID=A0A1E5KZF2_9ENTE|nr:NUDIX domain-containing protein [Enterococcus rivorum]OEH83205.1 hypothetical protein BCR26_10765 [Enterococcus rivorum]
MMLDCTFKTKKGRFNYRVGGIILKDEKMLVITNSKENYYYSIGGRVQMNETMDQAIEREVFEETGCHILTKRLGIIHENFFTSSVTNEKYHEISMYYYVDLKEKVVECLSINEFGSEESLVWLPLKELEKFDLRPDFLKNILSYEKTRIHHLVTE